MNKVKLPSNEIILYALALAGALTFAYAFLMMDGVSLLSVTGILLLLRGVVLGIAAGLGMAKISHALPRASKTNAPYLRGAFIVFLIVTPLIISPVTYAQMSPSMMALPWWIRVVVAISTGIFVDALTAGVAFASGKLEADTPQVAQPPQPIPQVAATLKKNKSKLRNNVTDADLVAEIKKQPGATDEQLAAIFGVSRQAINARRKKLTPIDMGLAKP